MWSAGSSVQDLYLGTRAVAAAVDGTPRLAQPVDGWHAGVDRLCDWLREAARSPRVRVWLSGGLCRPFMLEPVAGIRTAEQRVQAGGALAASRTGLNGTCAVWLQPATVEKATIAVALEDACLSHIRAAFAKHPARIVSIRPLWAAALNDAIREDALLESFALQDCDSVSVFCGRGASFDVATTITPVGDPDTAAEARNRALMSAEAASERATFVRLLLDARRAKVDGKMPLSAFLETVE